jgi:hypothetical protein
LIPKDLLNQFQREAWLLVPGLDRTRSIFLDTIEPVTSTIHLLPSRSKSGQN